MRSATLAPGTKQMNETQTSTANPFEVGDIIHTSWGYSMTLNSFYRVMRVTAKTVWLRELEKVTVIPETGVNHGYCGQEVPTHDISPRGEETRHRVLPGPSWRPDEPTVKTEHGYAEKWDGEPKHFNTLD